MSVVDLSKRGVRIVEGIQSTYHYHLILSLHSHSKESLCGAVTMYSGAPIDSWGFKPDHMPSRYCKTCEDLALELKEYPKEEDDS